MSDAFDCFRTLSTRVKDCINSIMGKPTPEEESAEADELMQKNRLKSITKATLELTEHYHSNSLTNTVPIAGDGVSRRSMDKHSNA